MSAEKQNGEKKKQTEQNKTKKPQQLKTKIMNCEKEKPLILSPVNTLLSFFSNMEMPCSDRNGESFCTVFTSSIYNLLSQAKGRRDNCQWLLLVV